MKKFFPFAGDTALLWARQGRGKAMAAAQDNPALRHIRRLVSGPGVALSDRELLQRYVESRDEAAFAALVERHGPMVLGLCQAILSNRHDAEDACQATFVVLARKAGSIRKRDSAGSWLHGVAYRVARKALAAAARRHALDAKAGIRVPEGSADDLSWREVRAILHAELAALPERFREPLILCYLEGYTQDEAARRLGWAVTTVKGRLQQGRELLRGRLVRKGLDLAALLGATLVAGQSFAAPVQPMLIKATLRAVFPATGDTANSTALNLAHGILQLNALRKFSLLAAFVLLATAAVVGNFAFLRETPAEREPAPPAQQGPARLEVLNDAFGDPLPQGAIARLGTIRFNHGDGLNSLHFSPDGKTVVSEGNGFVRTWDAATGKELAQLTTTKTTFDNQTALTPDGKKMILFRQEFTGDKLQVFDLEQATEIRHVALPVRRSELSAYRHNAVSLDGRLCAVHTAKLIHVFEIETSTELYKLPKPEEFKWVCFAGNDWLVTADKKKLIEVRQAKSGELVRQFDHGFPVEVMVASPDGRLLATAEHHGQAVDRLLDRDVIHLWDLTTGTLKHTLPARPKQWYMKMHFSGNGKRFFANSIGSSGCQLSVWDTKSGQRVSEFSGVTATVLAVSPDGNRLATGALPGKFELVDLRNGRRLSPEVSLHAQVPSVFLSADGARAFTMGYSSFNAWDGTTGRRLDSYAIDLPPSLYDQPTINHSRDGRYALSFTGDLEERERQILVWDLAKRGQIQRFQVSRAVRGGCAAISPDGSILVTSHPGKETIVRIWDVRTGKELRSFKDSKAGWPGSIFLTADGNTLFLAGRQQIVGFDIRSTRQLFSWRMAPVNFKSRISEVAVGAPPANPEDRLAWQSLTVSADGRTIACICPAPMVKSGWRSG
jgi:RNA polymerase sigma factor (sigma-70 family)